MTTSQRQLIENYIRKEVRKRLHEATDKFQIEAYGAKGLKSTPWRKIFNSPDQLTVWADSNDAEIYGTRILKNGQDFKGSIDELPNNFKGE